MNMFQQAKLSKMYLIAIKEIKKDIKDYLKLKNTQGLNRSKLAEVIRKKRKELYSIITEAKIQFPTVNYIQYYNN